MLSSSDDVCPRAPIPRSIVQILRLVAIVAIVVAGCATPSPSTEPSRSAIATPSPSTEPARPAVANNRDARFELQLQAPSTTYGVTDVIEPVALVTYVGPAPNEVVYHASSMVGFRIAEIEGGRSMDGGMDMPCLRTRMSAGETLQFPFAKAGVVADDPAEGFDEAWYREPELRLPPGRWRITAYFSASLGDCGGEPHAFETAIEITVNP